MSVRYIKAALIQDVACLRNRIITQVICKREQLLRGTIPFADVKYVEEQIDYIDEQMKELENKIYKIMTDYLELEETNEETD